MRDIGQQVGAHGIGGILAFRRFFDGYHGDNLGDLVEPFLEDHLFPAGEVAFGDHPHAVVFQGCVAEQLLGQFQRLGPIGVRRV